MTNQDKFISNIMNYQPDISNFISTIKEKDITKTNIGIIIDIFRYLNLGVDDPLWGELDYIWKRDRGMIYLKYAAHQEDLLNIIISSNLLSKYELEMLKLSLK